MRLLLVRHGHVDGISPERFRGRRDVPLSPQGVQQALDVAEHIAQRQRPVVVYTSPLLRCTETASAIAAATAVDVQVLADLIDLDYGDWQWLTRDDVRRGWPDLIERWDTAPQLVRFPHGDSLQDLIARVSNVLRMLLDRHAGDTVVVVGHDSGNRALLLQLFDQPASSFWRFTQDPCGLSDIEIARNGARLIRLNDTSYLRDLRL
jgi:broad specificity phosphatase PhoE